MLASRFKELGSRLFMAWSLNVILFYMGEDGEELWKLANLSSVLVKTWMLSFVYLKIAGHKEWMMMGVKAEFMLATLT